MNPQRMQLKGELADAQHKHRDLDVRASGSITLIQGYLAPYEHDVTKKRVTEALIEMKRLAEIHKEMTELKARIAELEDALNG